MPCVLPCDGYSAGPGRPQQPARPSCVQVIAATRVFSLTSSSVRPRASGANRAAMTSTAYIAAASPKTPANLESAYSAVAAYGMTAPAMFPMPLVIEEPEQRMLVG